MRSRKRHHTKSV